jgi:hypothetical protein
VFAFLDFFQFVGQDLLIAKMGHTKEKTKQGATKLLFLVFNSLYLSTINWKFLLVVAVCKMLQYLDNFFVRTKRIA